MVILDTNILSALLWNSADRAVVEWLAIGSRACCVHQSDRGNARTASSFDSQAAHELMSMRQQKGRAGDLSDAMIAGIALARRAILAKRNTRNFDDLSVPILNPWEAAD
jgi:toxin FitB